MFLYSSWISLPLNTRTKLASQFGIPKKGSTEVFSNVIKHGGYDVKDIEASLTIAAIKNYLNTSEESITILWPLLIGKIEGKVPEQTPDIKPKRKTKK